MPCKYCEIPLPPNYTARKCAFESGVFVADNWHCGTLDRLRELIENPLHTYDQYAALIPVNGKFVVLGWYKSRGHVEYAGLLSEDTCTPLTLEEAEYVLKHTPQRQN